MSSSTAPNRLTATEAVALTRSGKLSVEEYAKSLLAQIEKRDPQVHAWVHLDPAQVLARARELDAVPVEKRGPLHGLAVAVKVNSIRAKIISVGLKGDIRIGCDPYKGFDLVFSRSLYSVDNHSLRTCGFRYRHAHEV
jgi:hypothetical protein